MDRRDTTDQKKEKGFTPDCGFRPLQGGPRIGDSRRKAPDHEHSIFMGALEWVKKVNEGERRES